MAIAESSQTRLAYIAEVTEGTTPATPAFKTARFTSEGIRLAKQTAVSDEVRADGNVSSIADVGRRVEGPLNFELSYGTFDDFLEAVFRGAWTTNVLKNGFTPRPFTFEKTFEQGATDAYIRYRGCRVNQLDLALEARRIITGSFGIVGIGSPAPTAAIITGATYAAATTTEVMNAAANLGTITLGGITATPKMQSINLSLRSNLFEQPQLGALEPAGHGQGRFEASGTLRAYFENLDLYNAIINHTDVSLLLTIGATAGSRYTLSLPQAKLMEGHPVAQGANGSVLMDVPFQAYYNAGAGATAQLTRAV